MTDIGQPLTAQQQPRWLELQPYSVDADKGDDIAQRRETRNALNAKDGVQRKAHKLKLKGLSPVPLRAQALRI